eukprot:CAMPEP_0202032208 /NCGR_PEP_ID=MMETSP0905-20130828/65413_1 /ASSEMBLY_ACC=CAM_ASM_000554 /TAXON_ID=420261 /ORGANISM="Thalassiosira antarctica, Strain CCMP982" /LENGTH=273 /DNA_ID=CAMNT_0048596065 /DNA_START=86 /DNA_END=908 /DNA_ORIENTATION=-
MAIHTKKRDRVITMTPTITTSTTSTTSSTLACSSCLSDQEEYERAVAFLREFHSQRVSTSLDAILEADHIDEMLASDFSLALSVGQHDFFDAILEADHIDEMLASDFSLALSVGQQHQQSDDLLSSGSVSGSNNKTIMMKRNKESFLEVLADVPPLNDYATANNDHQRQQRRTTSRLRRNPISSLSRMKKAATSQCLLDLDDSTSSSSSDHKKECSTLASAATSSGGLRRSSSSLFPECASALDTDYYFGYDDESLPMTKRHRSSHYLDRTTL